MPEPVTNTRRWGSVWAGRSPRRARPSSAIGFDLVARTVFITGAGRGVGRATALAFAEAGADLVLIDICASIPECPYPMATREGLEETAEQCRRAGARVVADEADVRSSEQV